MDIKISFLWRDLERFSFPTLLVFTSIAYDRSQENQVEAKSVNNRQQRDAMVIPVGRSQSDRSLLSLFKNPISPGSQPTNLPSSKGNPPTMTRNRSYGDTRSRAKVMPRGFNAPPAYVPYVPPGHELKRYSLKVEKEYGQRELLVSNSIHDDGPLSLSSPSSPPPTSKVLVDGSLTLSPSSLSGRDFRRTQLKRNSSKRSFPRKKNKKQSQVGAFEKFRKENKMIRSMAERTEELLDHIEDHYRQKTAKGRISEVLLNLRAASELRFQMEEEQEKKLEEEQKQRIKSKSSRKKKQVGNDSTTTIGLRDIVGDVGLAMLSPLDTSPFELPLVEDPEETSPEDTEEYPIELVAEALNVTKSSPRILTPEMMKQLADKALPEMCKTMRWNRVYSASRDGDAFCTFLGRVSQHKYTIMAVRTDNGDILGGFATEAWKRQEGFHSGRSFFGSGQSFLFSNHPSLKDNTPSSKSDGEDDSSTSSTRNSLTIYKWTGLNTYSQICDVDDGQIAMGGGGAFGLVVDENFSRGCTGRCGTFDNPPLISVSGGRFDIEDFEVYGFECGGLSTSGASVGSTLSLRSMFSDDYASDPAQ